MLTVRKPGQLGVERLVRTVQELSLARNIEAVMHIVRTVARELTGADGATFVLREGDLCYYAEEDVLSPLWKGARFPVETCISGWVMLHKKPAMIENIYEDDRIPAEAYRPTFVKSLLMVPIRTIDPIGAIGNYWADYHLPSAEEVTLLQALADITAVSIENIEVRNNLEQKVMERTQELTESLEREKEMNKMKSRFVSIASHEFRTPLSTILSSAFLIERYSLTEQQEKRLWHTGKIKSAIQNLTSILEDFLSLDKLEEGRVEVQRTGFNLKEFIVDVIEEVSTLTKNGQCISYTHQGSEWAVLDKKILNNIMLNLLSNAIKYSDHDIEMRVNAKDEQITFTITDRGIGIPEEEQRLLFEKFFRAKNVAAIQGTGLGLNIVKRYVELLDGSIDFRSKENEGTTFTIILPCKSELNKRVTLADI